MPKKRRVFIVLIITVLLVGLVSWLISLASREKDSYKWKGYEREELISMFQNQKPMFDQVVKVIISNETFWDKARSYEADSHAWIMSPNDNKKMNLFTLSEQNTLRDFFEKTKPYEISLANNQYVEITYINKDKTDAFQFAYYPDYNSEWISYKKGFYKNFISMGGDWFLYW